MAKTSPRQLLLPLFSESCYVCWQVFSESETAPEFVMFPKLIGDGLCVSHRARLQEGACLYCGRRLAWLRMAGEPALAVCRPCFVRRKGDAMADAVDAIQSGDALGLIVS
jgi:hypothetical protein